jgi:hypothetical protein
MLEHRAETGGERIEEEQSIEWKRDHLKQSIWPDPYQLDRRTWWEELHRLAIEKLFLLIQLLPLLYTKRSKFYVKSLGTAPYFV